MPGPLINTTVILQQPALDYWAEQVKLYDEKHRVLPDVFDQMQLEMTQRANQLSGDEIRARVEDVFMNGIGDLEWGTVQIRIFKEFLKSCLPLIYGDSWTAERTRVMAELHMIKEQLYTLVNMARRNGKTHTTAGASTSLFFSVPEIKIAIFSTCKRTSQLLLNTICEMIDKTLDKGTHADRQNWIQVTRNSESIVMMSPLGFKCMIGCFPGSVRVSLFCFL